MGNKLCTKKVDTVDGTANRTPTSSFKGIISRLSLKPKWKSDSQLNKQRQDSNRKSTQPNNAITQDGVKPEESRHLSKSTDWTDVPLVVPTTPDFHIPDSNGNAQKSQVSLIFNDNHTPTPPPRKNTKKGIRERIRAVTKSGLQAVHLNGSNNQSNNGIPANARPVDEPLCIKKVIDYSCPNCNIHGGSCGRHTNNTKTHVTTNDKPKPTKVPPENALQQFSNSTSSLPTINDLKLSMPPTQIESIDDHHSSAHSLPNDNDKDNKSTDGSYMSRARSFGSLLPQMILHKLSTAKAPLAEIESDDSFGGLEDWDVGLIEHYNPKDASLPRGTRARFDRSEQDVLSGLEGLIVQNEEVRSTPEPPSRKTETLLKKITRENSENSLSRHMNLPTESAVSATPPPSPERCNSISIDIKSVDRTNPFYEDVVDQKDHSTLMKILEEYNVKNTDKDQIIIAKQDNINEVRNENKLLNETRESIRKVDDFLSAERMHANLIAT